MSARKGFTLLEVLISAMVIMIGILGVATLIPASKFQINEAVKADMAATIGRSALKTMITQNWMAYLTEVTGEEGDTEGFKIAGIKPVSKDQVYWFNWYSRHGGGADSEDGIRADFYCTCDLVPNPLLYTEGEEPPYYDTSLRGKFEWSGTIRKVETKVGTKVGTSYGEVSAAVSYQRGGRDSDSEPVEVSNVKMFDGCTDLEVTYSGDYEFRPGEWIYVSNSACGHWYKIIQLSAAEESNSNKLYFTLQGPDWVADRSSLKISTPRNVIAVYTEMVPLSIR